MQTNISDNKGSVTFQGPDLVVTHYKYLSWFSSQLLFLSFAFLSSEFGATQKHLIKTFLIPSSKELSLNVGNWLINEGVDFFVGITSRSNRKFRIDFSNLFYLARKFCFAFKTQSPSPLSCLEIASSNPIMFDNRGMLWIVFQQIFWLHSNQFRECWSRQFLTSNRTNMDLSP